MSLAPFARLFYWTFAEGGLGSGRRWRICGAVLFGALAVCPAQRVAAGWRTAGRFSGQATTKDPAGKTVIDETGRSVTVPAEVKRIVTLAPDQTETIYALGLGERLAGDTDDCDTPPAAKDKPHVGNAVNPNLEAIVALHPDLVLATTSINRAATVDALRGLGFAVYTSDPHTVRGTLESIGRVAEIAGAGAEGTKLVAQLQARLNAVHARVADLPLVHVLFVVWEDPLISVGQNTFIADALRWAGGESVILTNQNWPRVGLEEIVRLQPEFILLTGDHMRAEGAEDSDFRSRAGWKELRAVQRGHVGVIGYGVDRPSPALIDAIEQLARVLHPEAFKDKGENGRGKMEYRLRLHASVDMCEELNQCVR
ncbi:MAG: cobalamin-binding protein [Candidatus Acidiferrales bacterium]